MNKISFQQDNGLAKVTIVDGGIGQKMLMFKIYARETSHTDCLASVYINSSAAIMPSRACSHFSWHMHFVLVIGVSMAFWLKFGLVWFV